MGFFSNWFRKGESDDYEQILATIESDIQKRQIRLSEIRLRERRTTLKVTLYTLAFWVVYVSLWYTQVLPVLSGHRPNTAFEKFVKGVPVLIGPILILFARRIAQVWYTRIGDAEEKTLVTLRKQQREKIEEIKKKTNYYTTRNLLDRYDESVLSPGTPPQRRQPVPQTPVQAPPRQPNQNQGQVKPQKAPTPPISQATFTPMPVTPQPPPRKQWYDKLADAILGDDDPTGSPSSRYALICQKCFAHNGLVKESVWQDTQYVCPKCGHFNPSARSIQQGITFTSPSPISAMNSRGPDGVNGFPHSPLNQPIPIPLPQRHSKLSPEPAKLRSRKSFKREEDEDIGHGGTTVDMDVDNDSS
ncbi:hypothetical protein BJ322DRAFT_1068471 [Thelephora terrestris]|uniref:Endoplasmic reticulum junction formation protein lunapark n=1 Tax=Thelephora terrestris TaxID=56493 RepID=A0A9P6HCW2_9AGAM|nr:hypothetical protein BJ322DRAFT_1068471 [Thelephora terrestris]